MTVPGEPHREEDTVVTVVESGRATMEAYINKVITRGSYGEHFTDDVSIDVVGTGQTARGRAAVEGMIRAFHEQMFDAQLELKTLIVEGDRAAAEADFVARHTGEFAGIAPTGRQLRVPYSVVYDLEGSQIKALRIYGLASDLIRALQPESQV
jgi:predicted ester cyclase